MNQTSFICMWGATWFIRIYRVVISGNHMCALWGVTWLIRIVCIYDSWLVHVYVRCDMTHLCVYMRCDVTRSCIYMRCDMIYSYISSRYQWWLLSVCIMRCDMTHSYVHICIWVMTRPCICEVWHDSFTYVYESWLVHIYVRCDMTHSYRDEVWHDWIVRVTRHIHMCGMAHSHV